MSVGEEEEVKGMSVYRWFARLSVGEDIAGEEMSGPVVCATGEERPGSCREEVSEDKRSDDLLVDRRV